MNPIAPAERFEQEYCDRCSNDLPPADLIPPFRPDLPIISYRWRCPKCRTGWVTEDSDMDNYNEAMYARQLLEGSLDEES